MALTLSRILHAGYVLESGSTKIAFDPIFENPFSVNCHAFPKIRFDTEKIRELKLDAVFISHYHDDHCSLESLNLLGRDTPIYFFCQHEELFALIKELGFKNVYPLHINEPVQIGAARITPRRALDADVDSILQIETENLKILNVVDSWIDDETLELLAQENWDLILWPFQTMREIEAIAPSLAGSASEEIPPEWIPQLRKLNPGTLVPSSCQFAFEEWSWLNKAFFPISYAGFAKQIRQILPDTQIIRMNPGTAITLGPDKFEKAAPLGWIHPIGEQDLDYDFDPKTKPQPTAEIAKHFAKLSPEENARIEHYVETELPRKFADLEPAEDPFFDSPKLWRLSIFDHEGRARHLHFQIQKSKLEPAPAGPPDWTTEIITQKLYGALENGESLTSMYIRVNDGLAFRNVDVLEDPLIRCLFTGPVGSYQSAQLRRIQRDSSSVPNFI